MEESPSSATLPRARLAYVGPAPERSHSLTDLSEAPLYRAGVFGLHGTSLDAPLCKIGLQQESICLAYFCIVLNGTFSQFLNH